MRIMESYPDASVLIKSPVEDVALSVLRAVASRKSHSIQGIIAEIRDSGFNQGKSYSRDDLPFAERSLYEAWIWLETGGFLIPSGYDAHSYPLKYVRRGVNPKEISTGAQLGAFRWGSPGTYAKSHFWLNDDSRSLFDEIYGENGYIQKLYKDAYSGKSLGMVGSELIAKAEALIVKMQGAIRDYEKNLLAISLRYIEHGRWSILALQNVQNSIYISTLTGAEYDYYAKNPPLDMFGGKSETT